MTPVSGKRRCKALERKGWTFVRTKGSHFHYEHPDFPGTLPVSVHVNRDLKLGTQKDIMRQAGLPDAEL
jgi:predicted RNA binding protein YcfA (HicA-like mRNA interferase family)